jgi:hypothetical protein
MAEGCQRIERGAHFENNTPAVTAVAAVGSAAWHVFFAVEMDHAIAAFTGLYEDFCLIYEHKNLTILFDPTLIAMSCWR